MDLNYRPPALQAGFAMFFADPAFFCFSQIPPFFVSGFFRAPIFKCKQKDIFLCPEDLNYRPPSISGGF